jgi:CheY-like chemotaxis protein
MYIYCIFYFNFTKPTTNPIMFKETRTGKNDDSYNQSAEFIFDMQRKRIETYSLATLASMTAAVILIIFDLRLLAGCIIIIGACLGVIVVKMTSSLLKKGQESFKDISISSEKKDDVITDFSHKIREPLNNLVIIGDLLMGAGLQKKQKELLETFIASTNNMVTTVNELTMQSAGNISYEARKNIRFNLLSTIQNTIELYSLKDKTSIDFILNKKEIYEYDFVGDPIILKQIFLDIFNTIENQDSDRPTKVTITLKKRKGTGNNSLVDLRIQTDRVIVLIDNKGLPGNLASKMISSSNGYFNQEFGSNNTVLNITLPFVSSVSEPVQQIASPKIEELKQREKTRKELKDINILLVEDNTINQKITLLTLKPLVNNIDTATNGKEALDKFGTSNYDLILMDIQMPVMSGLMAAEKIRSLETSTNSHIPIIAITANALLGDKERCLSSGMDDYISKPFQPSALIDKINKFL